jgi:cell division protease FtsH
VLLLRGPEEHGMRSGVSLEVACDDPGRAPGIVAAVRQLSMEHNVFRGHVISFDNDDLFDQQGASLLSFVERPGITREQVILCPDLLAVVEQQVLGVARHAARLRASGQHLRRGILLYGPPGLV